MLTFGYSCISAMLILDVIFEEYNNAASLNYLQATDREVHQYLDGDGDDFDYRDKMCEVEPFQGWRA